MPTQTPPEPASPDLSKLSRLGRSLQDLLWAQRIAALGTLDDKGMPFVSMVPYALAPEPGLVVVHVSGLAPHTAYMQQQPLTALMVVQAEQAEQPVHALPRISLQTRAETLTQGHAHYASCRQAYLLRFPEAEPMTDLPDFRFVALHPLEARHVAGFGAARLVDGAELRLVLRQAT